MVEIETQMIECGGHRFEVDVCGDSHSRRLALFLHGFPECAYSWRFQMPLLAERGYKCWAPNQRGYGNSFRPSGARNYTIDCLVDDAAALIDASGCESVTLIAHDWGGVIGWMLALRRTRSLDRFIVMNLPHPTLFLRGLETSRQRGRSWYALFFQLPWLPERLLLARRARAVGEAFRRMAIDKSRFPDEVLDHYREHALRPGRMTAMLNWYRAVRFQSGLREELENPPSLDVPTLMIWGEQDSALGVELTDGTEELVEDFTLVRLPQVSHWVQQEAPEKVNSIIEDWLGAPRGGGRQSSVASRPGEPETTPR